MHAQSLSCVWFFVTPWTVACQAPLYMGLLQARMLEWVAIFSSRGSSQPRNRTRVSSIASKFFIIWDTSTLVPETLGTAALVYGEGDGTPLQYSCLENPWTEEPGRLQSMGSLRVGYDWATWLSLFTFMHWRRKWQPTPVFLPGESQGWGSLVGCRLWGCTESDTTEAAAAALVYPSGPNVITRVLKRNRERQRRAREMTVWERLGPMLLALKLEEWGWSLEAG